MWWWYRMIYKITCVIKIWIHLFKVYLVRLTKIWPPPLMFKRQYGKRHDFNVTNVNDFFLVFGGMRFNQNVRRRIISAWSQRYISHVIARSSNISYYNACRPFRTILILLYSKDWYTFFNLVVFSFSRKLHRMMPVMTLVGLWTCCWWR